MKIFGNKEKTYKKKKFVSFMFYYQHVFFHVKIKVYVLHTKCSFEFVSLTYLFFGMFNGNVLNFIHEKIFLFSYNRNIEDQGTLNTCDPSSYNK